MTMFLSIILSWLADNANNEPQFWAVFPFTLTDSDHDKFCDEANT